MKKKKYITIIFIIFFILYIISLNFIGIVKVNGDSMNPTLFDGNILLSNKYDNNYKRFDIVYFKKGNSVFIKRIIGLPNEHLEYKNNQLYINDQKVFEDFDHGNTKDFVLAGGKDATILSNCYFVLGDNRENSIDSRGLGFIREEQILGKILN